MHVTLIGVINLKDRFILNSRIRQYLAYTSAFSAARALIQSTIIFYLIDVMQFPLAWTTVLLAIDLAMTLASEIPTGFFADIKGRHNSFIVACALSVLGALIYGAPIVFSISSSPTGLFAVAAVAEAILAVSFSFYSGALDAWIVDSIPQTKTSTYTGRVLAHGQFAMNAAFMIFGAIGIFVHFQFSGSRIINTFLFSAIIMTITLLHSMIYMRELSKEIFAVNEDTIAPVNRGALLSTIKTSLQNSTLILLLVCSAICFTLLQLLVHFWPYFLINEIIDSSFDQVGMIGLMLSWTLAYGARSLGNYRAGKGMASRSISLQLCLTVLLGAMLVGGISVAPLSSLGIGTGALVASLLYASIRFFEGFAECVRLTMLTAFTVKRSRSTMYSISSFVCTLFSACIALGAAALLNLGATISHIWLIGAALQICTVPVYFVISKTGGWHEERNEYKTV